MAETFANKHVRIPENFTGLINFMPRAELVRLMSFLSYHSDLCLQALERRFGIETDWPTGAPIVPYDLPDGVELPETVLTRGAGPPS